MGTRLTFAEYEESAMGSLPNREADSSGASWVADIGGALVASALYMILLALGALLWLFLSMLIGAFAAW